MWKSERKLSHGQIQGSSPQAPLAPTPRVDGSPDRRATVALPDQGVTSGERFYTPLNQLYRGHVLDQGTGKPVEALRSEPGD